MTTVDHLTDARDAVLAVIEKNAWKGSDPFDGLLTPLARPFIPARQGRISGTNGAAGLARLAIIQAVKRSWIDLRPWLGIPQQENAMSWAVGTIGAAEAVRRGDSAAMSALRFRVSRVLALQASESGLWGYPFPWQARAFYVGAGDPNLVISAIALRALADVLSAAAGTAFPVKDAPERVLLFDESLKTDIRIAYRKALDGLFRDFTKPEFPYFSYVADKSVLVHNANFFGVEAVLNARSIGVDVTKAERALALEALSTSLRAQQTSGRWTYGDLPHHQWSDCFHTAYNLVSLIRIRRCLLAAGPECEKVAEAVGVAIQRGSKYYLAHAFTEDWRCRYYDNETWPLETHSIAAALVCLSDLARSGYLE
ncbi:MAG: hypothetical protein AAB425_00250, partial [Bdellovibrionota bacterium]